MNQQNNTTNNTKYKNERRGLQISAMAWNSSPPSLSDSVAVQLGGAGGGGAAVVVVIRAFVHIQHNSAQLLNYLSYRDHPSMLFIIHTIHTYRMHMLREPVLLRTKTIIPFIY